MNDGPHGEDAGYQKQLKPQSLIASGIDHVDEEILRILEEDARLPIEAVATRAGVSQELCQARMERLQETGHIGSYTILRNYPDNELRPIFGMISIVPAPERNGQDLIRSMESIPEIVTAEETDTDGSLLLRLQVPDLARLNTILDHFRSQFAVQSLKVTTTTPLMAQVPPRHPIGL